MKRVILLGTLVVVLTGCAGQSAPAVTVTATVTTTVTATPKAPSTPTSRPTPTPKVSALVAQIKADYPGYPLIVSSASIDSRVASAYRNSLSEDRVVALAPGLYTPYNPIETDLNEYIDSAPVDGDCVAKHKLFDDRGGSCWDGVQVGDEEPK